MSRKFVLIFIIAISFAAAFAGFKVWNNPSYQKIVFSETLHPKERATIQKMIEDDTLPSKAVGDDNVKIKIGKYDLNEDGIEDIFVQILGRNFGGSMGWATSIYLVDGKGRWKEVFGNTTFGLFGVMKQKHNGYHDFVRIGPKQNHPLCEDYLLVYRWRNGGYNDVSVQDLTKKDKGILYE